MFLTTQILLVTSAVLVYVAITEFRQNRVRNEVVLVLAGLYFVFAAVNQQWMQLLVNVGFAFLLFIPMLYAYSMRMMAGGDLKLFTAALLWVGPFCFLPFIALFSFFIAAQVGAARAGLVGLHQGKNRNGLALAPSIAAALIATFLTGCLDESARAAFISAVGQWVYDWLYWLLPFAPHNG
jgi:Flp pilus assembly protein protease CpaA